LNTHINYALFKLQKGHTVQSFTATTFWQRRRCCC